MSNQLRDRLYGTTRRTLFAGIVMIPMALCLICSAAQFQNGSFELGSVPAPPGVTLAAGSTAITGWLVLPSNIDWITFVGSVVASDGTWFLDLNGTQTGGIQQTFDTVSGATYAVTFDLNDNNSDGSLTPRSVQVSAAGISQVFTYTPTVQWGPWASQTFKFTAMASQTTLVFQSLVPDSDLGPLLDNVAVVETPAPIVSLSPRSLTFPTQLVLTESQPKSVSLVNVGDANLVLGKIFASGDFSVTTTCPGTVPPQTGCTISATFKPSADGLRKGVLRITDNAAQSPQKVALQGTGTFMQLVPASLYFGSQPVGTEGLSRNTTLTNTGGGAVEITSIVVTGTDPGDFTEKNSCGTTLAAGASCTIRITFNPLAKGVRTAAVSISDTDGGSPQSVQLTGTGT